MVTITQNEKLLLFILFCSIEKMCSSLIDSSSLTNELGEPPKSVEFVESCISEHQMTFGMGKNNERFRREVVN